MLDYKTKSGKPPNRNQVSSWPLQITRADNEVENYPTYEDFCASGRPVITKETINFRNRITREKGHYKGEKWLLLNHEAYHAMFNLKTFRCGKCNQEREIKYYDPVDEKEVKNYIVEEVSADEKIKVCVPCMTQWAKDFWKHAPILYPYERKKTLQDYYEEVRLEKELKPKKK